MPFDYYIVVISTLVLYYKMSVTKLRRQDLSIKGKL
jgi:hypothetical protein